MIIDKQKIDFEIKENTLYRDDLWQYDCINIFYNKKNIGYIRVAYINEGTINKFLEEPFLLLKENSKYNSFKFYKKEYIKEENKMSFLNIPNYYNQAIFIANIFYKNSKRTFEIENINKYNQEELIDYIYKHKNKIIKYAFKDESIYNFAKYHFLKADIDFISIDEQYQQNGFGKILYAEMAKFLKKKNILLYSSTLRQIGAEKSWQRFYNEGLAEKIIIKNKTEDNEEISRYRYIDNIKKEYIIEYDEILLKTSEFFTLKDLLSKKLKLNKNYLNNKKNKVEINKLSLNL